MDALSEILRSIRLTGGIFLDARFTAPWCVRSGIEAADCKPFLEAPTQIVAFHVVLTGALVAGVEGEPGLVVRAGEIVLLPRNDVHTLASGAGIAPIAGRDLIQPGEAGGLARAVHGGGGAATDIVCGFLASEALHNPLVAALPRLLKIDVREAASRDWVEAAVRFAAGELTAGRLASSPVVARLSELLFVEAVRNYSATLGEGEAGWLKGVADPQVGRALALIHGRIGDPWSAEALAREVALSRSAFVDRFTTLVGAPPIRYLTRLRLQTARLNLRETRTSIARLAHAVGYESEEAFSRAFKREFGLAPAKWRERAAA